MVNLSGTPPLDTAVIQAGVASLTKVEIKSLLDCIAKLFAGKISFGDVCQYVKGKSVTFAAALDSNAKVQSELVPLLKGLTSEDRTNKSIFDILSVRDPSGVSVAMIASTIKDGAKIIGELLAKLTKDQQIAILSQKTNENVSLYSFVASKCNEAGDNGSVQMVDSWYTNCNIDIDANEVISTIAQQEANALPSGFWVGALTQENQAENNRTAFMQMITSIGFDANDSAVNLTAEQVGKFLEWLNDSSSDGSNLDIFIGAFGGNSFEQRLVEYFCEKFDAFDDGETIAKVLKPKTYAVGGDEFNLHNFGAYAKLACFPDAVCKAISKLYRKCGLADDVDGINALPNTGPPILSGSLKTLSRPENKSVTISNTRGIDGIPLRIEGAGGGTNLSNVRQLGQSENVEYVTISQSVRDITVDDLAHLFEGAKHLKTFTLTTTDPSLPIRIDRKMVDEALARSGRNDIEIKYQ
ncbi:MAG: hypothetical protein LBI34_00925 [Puniceicoccales bacterium]|jgi:hypothetical protein|nr:hypothetical protein [Puniceicoccales bacterium]